MSEKDKGGPAFPHQKEDGSPYCGMSLRDWFAGQALMGILASGSELPWERDAENAYKAADAMLEARNG